MEERRRRRAIRERVLQRKKRWKSELLPCVHAAVRPNSTYLLLPHVTALLQHLSDGLNELLLTRPLAPFPYLADYLRHACKLSYQIEPDAVSLLVLEMHKKRRVIENALRDTKTNERSCKQLINSIVALQQTLELPRDEHRLDTDDLAFLATETPLSQDDWSIDAHSSVAFPTDWNDSSSHDASATAASAVYDADDAWLRTFVFPQRDLDTYYTHVLDGVVRALVHLQRAKPTSDDAATWLIVYLRTGNCTGNDDTNVSLFFKTNYELMRRIEVLKTTQRNVHARLERLQGAAKQLHDELTERAVFIAALATSHVTTRTHAIMDGTPVFLNAHKHWVLPGYLLQPTALSASQLLGLRRAEAFLMQQDERRWRHLLMAQQQLDASVSIQRTWRASHAFRAYKTLTAQRRAAATLIQRNYMHYLFDRAIRLPEWCVIGREVVVAPSVAAKCAITFQFYRNKDFSTGNYRFVPPENHSIVQMMELCRLDDDCAGFSTDGAMKRFVPRKLSQLQDITDKTIREDKTPRGLYVKVHPPKDASVVNTGIIVAVPPDRFGLVDVVLDGLRVVERVPLAKLYDRWRRMRIRRQQHRRGSVVRRAFVFGKATDVVASADRDGDTDNEVDVDLSSNNASSEFELLDELQELELDIAARRKQRRRDRQQQQVRAAAGSNSNAVAAAMEDVTDDDDALLEWLFEDQATKRVVRREPHHTFSDADERMRVIADRECAYRADMAKRLDAAKLASAIKLQCAWRSKRARAAFRQVLALRAKERARAQLVQQVHAKNKEAARTPTKKKQSTGSKGGFFAKLFRG